MCLKIDSLTRYKTSNGIGNISDEHYTIADNIFRAAWPHLDHTKRYCINPLYLAIKLLELQGVFYHSHWNPKGEKAITYNSVISHIWTQYKNTLL